MHYGKMIAPAPFRPETLHEIMNNPWPGNVRELRNHVRRLCILGGLEEHRDGGKSDDAPRSEDKCLPLKEFIDRTEKDYIIGVLRETEGQAAVAHIRLGISRKSFYDKIGKYRIDLSEFRKTEKGRPNKIG